MSKAGVGREKRKRVSDDEDDKEREVAQRAKRRARREESLLDSLARRSSQLLNLVLDWRTGAATTSTGQPTAAAALALEKRRQWLTIQQDFYESYLPKENDEAPEAEDKMEISENDAEMDEAQLEKREEELTSEIEQLQAKLTQLTAEKLQEDLLLHRVAEQSVLTEIMFPTQPEENRPPADEYLKRCLLMRNEKVQKLLKLQEKSAKLQNRRLKVQKAILQQKIVNRQKWKKYKEQLNSRERAAETPEASEAIQKLEQEISESLRNNVILRRVLQRVIMTSGIKWSKDSHLKELVLSLEDTPDITQP